MCIHACSYYIYKYAYETRICINAYLLHEGGGEGFLFCNVDLYISYIYTLSRVHLVNEGFYCLFLIGYIYLHFLYMCNIYAHIINVCTPCA